MKKKFLIFLLLNSIITIQSHVLDDVIQQCKTEFKDLPLSEKIGELSISCIATVASFALTTGVQYHTTSTFSPKWIPIHGAVAATLGYSLKNILHSYSRPEVIAQKIIVENPYYEQLFEYIESDTNPQNLAQRLTEVADSQTDAYNILITFKNKLIKLINTMHAIQKYNDHKYKALFHKLHITTELLQKSIRSIIKTEEWFLERIHSYVHIYTLIQRYDNDQLISELTHCYNGATYPRMMLINDMHSFTNFLTYMNKHEYAPVEFDGLRKRNNQIIEILKRIILYIENSYEYKAENTIKEQEDRIHNLKAHNNTLKIQNAVQDLGTLYLYQENLELKKKLEEEKRRR